MAVETGVVVLLHRTGELGALLRARCSVGDDALAADAGSSFDVDDVVLELAVDPLPLGVRAAQQLGEDEKRSVHSVFPLLHGSAAAAVGVDGDEADGRRVVASLVPGQMLMSGLLVGHLALGRHHQRGPDSVRRRFPEKALPNKLAGSEM